MNAPKSLNDLSHDEILAWLERALRGQETLPRLTPDESPHLGILRLERTLKPTARKSLWDGSLELIRRFCGNGDGEAAYVEQLLSLSAAFKIPEAVQLLAGFVQRFPPETCRDVRLAVLATLVDTPPPQTAEFWDLVLKQAPQSYAALALSGVLATHPARAVRMLPAMPNDERMGQAAALKLDLTWDDLPPKHRAQFIEDVCAILPRCGRHFAGPVRAWAESKAEPSIAPANRGLSAALLAFLGSDSDPRYLSPRLCAT